MRTLGLSLSLLSTLSVVACGDAIIGRDSCAGERVDCTEASTSIVETWEVQFTRVDFSSPQDLPVLRTLRAACNEPCTTPIQLQRAPGDAVWSIARTGAIPSLHYLSADGQQVTTLLTAPSTGATLSSFALYGSGVASAVGLLQWSLVDGSFIDELAAFSAPGVVSRLRMSTNTRPPTRLIPAQEGYLLYGEKAEDSTARLVAPDGRSTWQQAARPKFAAFSSGAAVELDDGFRLGASDSTQSVASHGVLTIDRDGNLQRFGVLGGAAWHGLRMLPIGLTTYAIAAASELRQAIATPNTGNIDVVVDSLVASDTSQERVRVGYRFERDCFHELSLNGFSADDQGNLYVSTVFGSRSEPRGLLCQLPLDLGGLVPRQGPARCYQGQPNQLFGEIVATSKGKLFIASTSSPTDIYVVQLPD